MLTSIEVAQAVGISPSTFRAYVSRGQAPKPRKKLGNTNLWSLTDLLGWRNFKLTDEAARRFHTEASRKLSLGRYWEDSVLRDLNQIGIDYIQGNALLAGFTPEGLTLAEYRDARDIIDIHRRLRNRIATADASPVEVLTEDMLLRAAAHRVSTGEDVFQVKADLTFELTSQGYPERLAPLKYDQAFWSSQDDETVFLDYLRNLEQTQVPKAV